MVAVRTRVDSRSLAAYLAFFLSGASSLIFQTIWTRMLHHVFGATSVAISTVLTVFMAGLGLGAWLGGKYANRIKHPIITYAVAEIGVGIWGLLVPLLVRSDGWLATVNMFLRAEFGAESGFFMVARFLCVAPILIIPTTLMGSTLPLLTRHFVASTHQSREASSRVGVLYAVNTFGAATGPLLSAFLLMPELGLSVTNIVACSMNFSLATVIFLARKPLLEGQWNPGEPLRFWPGTADEVPAPSPPGPEPTPEPEPPPVEKTASDAADKVFRDEPPDDAKVGAYRNAPSPKKRKSKRKTTTPTPTPPVREPALAAAYSRVLFTRLAIRLGASVLVGGVAWVAAKLHANGVLVGILGAIPIAIVIISVWLFFGARREALGGWDEEEQEPDRPVPELARKAAFLAFAASGAAALCYEVVWSRALAMTIGSSIYSFSLILETFLIGIAGGAAAMSVFMGRKSLPFVGIGVTSAALVLLANIPWAVDIVDPVDVSHRFEGGWINYALLSLAFIGPIVLAVLWITVRMRRSAQDVFRDDLEIMKPLITVMIASMPVIAAGINSWQFPGHLPKIILSVVAAISVFVVVASLLARTPVLLVAIIQLFIAGATVVSYIWQDEIPYAFAQLVAGIPQATLPDQVGTVKLFMFVTIILCTLPSTLGMGAMFPLTVRLWSSGGDAIARDVAHVYTANTVGSILGSWLPGFILFALIGAEHTLHLGVALNMLLALVLLIAGAADPSEDQSWWTWRRLASIGLPALAAIAMGIDAWTGGLHHPEFVLRAVAAVVFVALAVAQHQWLRRCDAVGGKPGIEIAGPVIAAPVLATIGLAAYLVSPETTTAWAAQAVVVALKCFIVLVGAVMAWAAWREWSSPVSPSNPTPSEA